MYHIFLYLLNMNKHIAALWVAQNRNTFDFLILQPKPDLVDLKIIFF